MKKVLAILMAVLVAGALMAMAAEGPNTVTEETIGSIPSLDPAYVYDNAGGEALWQVYDNLLQYDGTSLTKLIPMLSTNVPSAKDGTILDNGTTYVFHIRQGVYFHNGDILTPQDVVYSLERTVIFDRSGGPTWMLAEPFLPEIGGAYVDSLETWAAKLAGVSSYSDLFEDGTNTPKNAKYEKALEDAFNLMAKDFTIKGNDVIIHLPHSYPPFLFILAHGAGWSSIMDEKWAVSNGAWDGQASTWWKYHNPSRENDPLYSIEDGTGPFMLNRWTKGREIVFQRFDQYWAGPAKIQYAIIKFVNEFTTRKLDLMRGNADIIYVPEQYMSQVENVKGISVTTGLPMLSIDNIYYTWTINAKGNRYIGSGKIDGKGIPSDFFSNKDVRLAFEYLFPYKQFINQVWVGQAIVPNGVVPKGMLGYDAATPTAFHQDLAKAEYYFKKAYNGELWNKGFSFTAVYNTGNSQRQTALEMLKYYAKKLNPKFNISVVGEIWASFLDDYIAGKLPMYMMGWLADYPDPYDFAQPYYASTGAYGSLLGQGFIDFAKKNMDPLLSKSMQITDPQARAQLYLKMDSIAQANGLYLWTDQPLGHHVQSSNLKGWFFNPMMPGQNFYGLYK